MCVSVDGGHKVDIQKLSNSSEAMRNNCVNVGVPTIHEICCEYPSVPSVSMQIVRSETEQAQAAPVSASIITSVRIASKRIYFFYFLVYARDARWRRDQPATGFDLFGVGVGI